MGLGACPATAKPGKRIKPRRFSTWAFWLKSQAQHFVCLADHPFWRNRDNRVMRSPDMQAIWVNADMRSRRDVELIGDFRVLKKPPFDEFHFRPCRATVCERHADMIPTRIIRGDHAEHVAAADRPHGEDSAAVIAPLAIRG